MNKQGELDLDALDKMLSADTRMLSVVHISNSLGTVNPVKEMARMAHAAGIGPSDYRDDNDTAIQKKAACIMAGVSARKS